MAWLQLIIQTNGSDAALFDDQLVELGAVAVTLQDNADQPLFEPPPGTTPIWEDTRVIGLFEDNVDIESVISALKSSVSISPFPQLKTEALEDKDWVREWMDSFHPICFGERLWVVPSWLEAPDPNAVNMLLDPGLAFGTGTHQTTALCLRWLDQQQLQDKIVIDYGCGSGILAIAAALLGASQVYCVDNDPQALLATQQNAERNNVSEKIIVHSPETMGECQADILVANILAGPLMELAPRLTALVAPNGYIALSGILAKQTNDVANRYSSAFVLAETIQDEDWVRISGQKSG
ncbi:ribosomal protein L11 methyltransferase [Gammaproteobacteria bacterium 45_16_T64]|mgnify:CR=1 FL=1|nr:ribosomal protein L11 methyltransferase [Gammaproteobacteria bacterium 45_16_T64]